MTNVSFGTCRGMAMIRRGKSEGFYSREKLVALLTSGKLPKGLTIADLRMAVNTLDLSQGNQITYKDLAENEID